MEKDFETAKAAPDVVLKRETATNTEARSIVISATMPTAKANR